MDQSVTITPLRKAFQQMPHFRHVGRTIEGTSEAKVAVQTISPNGKVTVTFAWGIVGDNNPGEAAGSGKIVGTTLKLGRLPNGADVSLMMLPDGTLAGTYMLAGQTYTGVFIRQ